MLDLTETIAAPLNNMAFQFLKLIGITLLATGIVYLFVKTVTSSHGLAKILSLLAFGLTFYFALFNVFLSGLQGMQ